MLRNMVTGTLVAALMGAGGYTTLNAQPGTTTSPQNQRMDERQRNTRQMDTNQNMQHRTVRASELIGKNIQNGAEESVGEIADIVLNQQTGKVEYVAVTYGGFLGMGDKMFAVPHKAFKVQPDPDAPNDPSASVLVLDVTQQQLEGAEGFDQDNWPDSSDRNWKRDLNQRYGVQDDDEDRMRMRNNGVNSGTQRNNLQRERVE